MTDNRRLLSAAIAGSLLLHGALFLSFGDQMPAATAAVTQPEQRAIRVVLNSTPTPDTAVVTPPTHPQANPQTDTKEAVPNPPAQTEERTEKREAATIAPPPQPQESTTIAKRADKTVERAAEPSPATEQLAADRERAEKEEGGEAAPPTKTIAPPPPPAATTATAAALPTTPPREPMAGRLGEEERAHYLALLLAHIESHKYYPRAARKRGIEGGVDVSFLLLPSGEIAAIDATGGPTLLRRAALKAINAALPLPTPPKPLTRSLPVKYRMAFLLQ